MMCFYGTFDLKNLHLISYFFCRRIQLFVRWINLRKYGIHLLLRWIQYCIHDCILSLFEPISFIFTAVAGKFTSFNELCLTCWHFTVPWALKPHHHCLPVKFEARPAVEKRRKTKLNFNTDSDDILIDNCCSHALTYDLQDHIDPPVKLAVRVRGHNGSTNSTRVGRVKWKIKDDNCRNTTLYCQKHIIHLQWKLDYYHHNIGLKFGI
jgi:hypothetical protein